MPWASNSNCIWQYLEDNVFTMKILKVLPPFWFCEFAAIDQGTLAPNMGTTGPHGLQGFSNGKML